MTKAGGVVQTASYDFVLNPNGLLAPRGDNADSASLPVVRTGGYVGVPGDIGPDLDADQLKELNTIHVSMDRWHQYCVEVWIRLSSMEHRSVGHGSQGQCLGLLGKQASLKVDHSVNHLEQCCHTCLVLTLRPFLLLPRPPFPPFPCPCPLVADRWRQ